MAMPLSHHAFASKLRAAGKEKGGKVFWLWIGYQTIKGIITTSLIWVPLWMTFWSE